MPNVLERLLGNLLSARKSATPPAPGASDGRRSASPSTSHGGHSGRSDGAIKAPLDEKHLRLLVDGIQDYAVFMLDPKGIILSWNTGAKRIKGYAPGEIIGQHFSRLYPREDVTAGKPARELEIAAATGRYEEESWRARKDGSLFWANMVIAALRNEAGNLIGFSKVTRDLTERKRREEEARRLLQEEAGRRAAEESAAAAVEARLHLASIVESSDDAIIGQDLDGNIMSWNKGAEELYGYTSEDIVGCPISILVPADHPDEVPALMERIRSGERVEHFETVRVRKGGARVNVSLTISPIRNASGQIIGASKIARDVTACMTVALENARIFEEMKHADRRKDEWIAMLAHELRNPLAPMRNALHILSRPDVDPDEGLHAQKMADRQMRHLVRLVDDLLDLSRIMRSRIELRKEQVNLACVVARGVETVMPKIDAAGHDLIVSMPDEVLKLEADPDRLSQVVANLVDNASKFSGRVARIWVTLERDGNDGVLRVRDEGIGMRADLAARAFDPFVQADQSLERSRGGLGIGLTIVRKLVELHGGTIAAHSAGLGQGSELVVRLPGVRATAAGDAPALPADGAAARTARTARRVLVVDDNVDAAESTAMILRLAGHSVHLAYDGPEVLRVADETHPDVIVLDIGLPGMNGYEVAKKLRERGTDGKPLLIALTGYGQDSDRRRASDAGFDHHLTKPVDPDALQMLIASA